MIKWSDTREGCQRQCRHREAVESLPKSFMVGVRRRDEIKKGRDGADCQQRERIEKKKGEGRLECFHDEQEGEKFFLLFLILFLFI